MLRVAAFTGGKFSSPARFRVRQYIQPIRRYEIEIKEFYAPLGAWPPSQKWLRPAWGITTIASRLPAVIASHGYDVTLLQQSMVSTLYTLEGLTAHPRVLDLDDAIWAFARSPNFFSRLVRGCDGVICGNAFLADYVIRQNKRVTVIPTGVDTDYFRPSEVRRSDKCIIGWSGGRGGFRHLYMIEDAIGMVLRQNTQAVLSIVADKKPIFRNLPSEQVVYTPWTLDNEVTTIQAMDIGIMPLDDSIASMGKCSYKMLLYMACGKPVVASPVGMNQEVFAKGEVGMEARRMNDWIDGISLLVQDRKLRSRMGETGRDVVCSHYSTAKTMKKLVSFLYNSIS